MTNRRNKLYPIEVMGYDSKGIKRKKYLFPREATPEDIVDMIIDIVWKTRIEKALKENKPLMQVVREERVRKAIVNNEPIDIDAVMENEIKQYQEWIEYTTKQT